MALKKVDLRNVLEDEDTSVSEKVSALLDLMHNEIDAIKDERDDIRTQLEDALKNQAPDDSQINEWKSKYEAEREAFETYKTEQTAKETRASKEAAYRDLLISTGISEKRLKAVMKVADIDSLELEDGKIKGSESLAESIKTEWSDFIETQTTKGASTQTPPVNNGGEPDKLEDLSMADYIAARKKGAK